MGENQDIQQSVSTGETMTEEKTETKKKKISIVFKVWAVLVIILAILAGSLIAQEHALHRSWEKEEQEMYDSINERVTEMGTEAVQEHTAKADTDCLTASTDIN